MTTALCPALFLAAPASGQGKTTITAGLTRLLKRQGKDVRVFKTGPDYLDPKILEQASGQPVEQLDMWMAGDVWCQQQFFKAAQVADLILVEGAMGIFDGTPSSADLAARFNIPLVLIMDVKAMAQTAAAIAVGLRDYRDDFQMAGLIANNCASSRHQDLIQSGLPENLPLLMAIPNSPHIALPERHLGLVQAEEVAEELEQRLEAAADWLQATGDTDWLSHIKPVEFHSTERSSVARLLQGKTIAIARDQAFSFIYASNVKLLRQMGAELTFYSPLSDKAIPAADALWLPGGYPELHSQALSNNTDMLNSLHTFHQSNKPILAECGGFLYCMESLTDLTGNETKMAGVIAGKGAMRDRGGCQGMQTAPLPEGDIRGHAHHRTISSATPKAIAYGIRPNHPASGEAIYREGSLTASYLHLFFASNPEAVAKVFLGR